MFVVNHENVYLLLRDIRVHLTHDGDGQSTGGIFGRRNLKGSYRQIFYCRIRKSNDKQQDGQENH